MKSLQEMESDESRGKAQPPEPNTGENQNAEVPEVSDDGLYFLIPYVLTRQIDPRYLVSNCFFNFFERKTYM